MTLSSNSLFKHIPPEVIRDALLTYLKEHPEVLTSALSSHTLTQHLVTKEDLKLLISLIEKRFENMNKRFEDMNQKFSLIVKLMLSFDIPLLILVISLVIKSFLCSKKFLIENLCFTFKGF